MFGNPSCPYYKAAKNIMVENFRREKYQHMNVYNGIYSEIWREVYYEVFSPILKSDKKRCPYSTWPRIFHKKKFIGGFTELESLVVNVETSEGDQKRLEMKSRQKKYRKSSCSARRRKIISGSERSF